MLQLVEAYRTIINYHRNGIPIPREIGANNSILIENK